jgi:hypothetical protein
MEPPAEQTPEVAHVYSRSHLKTSMTLYAVELLFVAGSAEEELLPHPMAQLDRSALTDQAILLPLEVFRCPSFCI